MNLKKESILAPLLALACLSLAISCTGIKLASPQITIMNATELAQGGFPTLAMIFRKVANVPISHCAATILDREHILTAASCVASSKLIPLDVRSLVAKIGGKDHQVSRVMAHRSWSGLRYAVSNIAVLKLADTIELNDSAGANRIVAAKLPPRGDPCCDAAKEDLTAIGLNLFGLTLKYSLKSMSLEMCKLQFGLLVDDRVVCIAGPHALVGHPGGPLLKSIGNGTLIQVGLDAFSAPVNGNVFTKIAAFRDWIEKCMTDGKCDAL